MEDKNPTLCSCRQGHAGVHSSIHPAGCALLAIIFGGANAYLGLRVGMTVSASIPAAVISMGVIRKVLRRDSILETTGPDHRFCW